jgi:hypothetical protein
VKHNIRLPVVIIYDILDSDQLQIVFQVLDHVKTKKLYEPVENFTDWERFQRLASDLISPKFEIDPKEEADKALAGFPHGPYLINIENKLNLRHMMREGWRKIYNFEFDNF